MADLKASLIHRKNNALEGIKKFAKLLQHKDADTKMNAMQRTAWFTKELNKINKFLSAI